MSCGLLHGTFLMNKVMNDKMNINWAEKLQMAVKGYRQYRIESRNGLIVSKVWNKGQGLLALFRFYPDKKIILINNRLFNKNDSKNLQKIKKPIEAGDRMEQRAEYGYPDYYFKSFGLNNIKDGK